MSDLRQSSLFKAISPYSYFSTLTMAVLLVSSLSLLVGNSILLIEMTDSLLYYEKGISINALEG